MLRLLGRLVAVAFGCAVVAALVACYAAVLLYQGLPSLAPLINYQPNLPLRVYTEDGVLMGEYGEERHTPVKIEDVPVKLREAIVAAEDERFYQHHGIDYAGIVRAAIADLRGGGALQGASTITMQIARNFFLTREKTFARKIYEALLALKIDHELSKDQILDLYVNQIYLGEGAYGFPAAADNYFKKSLKELTIGEMAILAGLPKAPSQNNPRTNRAGAKVRRDYVLGRMHALKYLSDAEYAAAVAEPIKVRAHPANFPVRAQYVAELVRQFVYGIYHEAAYSLGLSVYTTIRSADQKAADSALREGVLEYDRRHGYRGPEAQVDLPADASPSAAVVERALRARDSINGLLPAVVLQARPWAVKAVLKGGETIEIRHAGLELVRGWLAERADPKRRLRRGALIRVDHDAKGKWQIDQLPQVEAALVSMDSHNGDIRALVGGFDFSQNKFDHVTQALRQVGSSFKPFIYSAALERGFDPASIIDDVPTTFDSEATGLKPWTPGNYEGDFLGPISMRTALAKSRNVASARVLQTIGISYARDYVLRFGFPPAEVPPYLSMVLGVGSIRPLTMAAAYAVFANGGYRITPVLITKMVDRDGNILMQTPPADANPPEPIIDPRNAFLMRSMMHSVIMEGTAHAAVELGRSDLAGKTGTTNDFTDAWFDGFNPDLVAVVWVGFDQPRTLGKHETGARAALPIWMKYMGTMLKDVPEQPPVVPDGIVQLAIDPSTGLPDPHSKVKDYFYAESVPLANPAATTSAASPASSPILSSVPSSAPSPTRSPIISPIPAPIPAPIPRPIPSPAPLVSPAPAPSTAARSPPSTL
jgi:penicillin-binding protein 1A